MTDTVVSGVWDSSKEEEAERLSAWEKYLEGEDDDDSSSKKVSEGMAF